MINKNNDNNKQVQMKPTADNTNAVFKKAIIRSAVALAVMIAILITYLVLPEDIKNPSAAQTEEEGEIQPMDGEVVLKGNNGLYMFPLIYSSSVKSLHVKNTNCEFTVNRADEDTFYINDNPNLTYSDDDFTSLIVATCNTYTKTRVYPDMKDMSGPEVIPYASFGLDEAGLNARYEITTTSGNKYAVRIGNMAPSGEGYYACLEGREAVYILPNDFQNSVLGTMENIVTPTLGLQALDLAIGESNYIDHMSIWHGGSHVTSIHSVSESDASLVDTIFNYAMTCKQNITASQLRGCATYGDLENVMGIKALSYNYVPNIDEYNEVASLLPNLEGEETVAIKDVESGTITEEQLAEFHISSTLPAYEIFYTMTVDGVMVYNHLLFSDLQEEEYYYAYSSLNSVIAKVPKDTIYFLDWDYAQWNEPSFFQNYITAMKEVKIESAAGSYDFKLQHGAYADGTPSITVTESGEILDSENFRNFYRVMLSRKLRGAYTGEIPGEDKLYLTMTVTTVDDKTTVYKFYKASTQQAFLTIDGEGEFYCLMSSIRKLENDAYKVTKGIEVGYEEWN